MLSRLFVDKKTMYMSLSLVMLAVSILSFNIFDYKYRNDAAIFKEKTEGGSMLILTIIGKTIKYDYSFTKIYLNNIVK